MTRDEELHQAAENYTTSMCNDCSARSYCEEKNKRCVECREQTKVFVDGAKWADKHPKNVWHDAEEEPMKDTYILIETSYFEDDLDYYSYYWSASSAPSWEEYVKENRVKGWTYISDILPKGGEK